MLFHENWAKSLGLSVLYQDSRYVTSAKCYVHSMYGTFSNLMYMNVTYVVTYVRT